MYKKQYDITRFYNFYLNMFVCIRWSSKGKCACTFVIKYIFNASYNKFRLEALWYFYFLESYKPYILIRHIFGNFVIFFSIIGSSTRYMPKQRKPYSRLPLQDVTNRELWILILLMFLTKPILIRVHYTYAFRIKF